MRRYPSATIPLSTLAGLLFLMAIVLSGPAAAGWVDLGGEPLSVNLLESDGTRSVFEIVVGGFDAERISIDGQDYYLISLDGESVQLEKGFPALPDVRRSLIISDDMDMRVTLLSSDHVDLPGMPVAPSKGNLTRDIDPATVPFTFDAIYQGDAAWPADPVEGCSPYILRDYRGMVVDANIFQYLPGSQTLRVYTRMVIEVAVAGPALINPLERHGALEKVDTQFHKLYGDQFINYGSGDRYVPVLEDGGLLIISYDAFAPAMAPLVDWKLQKGIPTKLVTLSETGASFSQIKGYISSEFTDWAPAYVLLVGDIGQIPIGGESDPEYSTLLGGDNYPELFVGRFSGENAAQVDIQVVRTITYERDQLAGDDWPQYGMGVASDQGPGDDGEYDDEHEDVIRQKLLDYGYLGVDQIYDPTGTASQVTTGLNAGRGIVNYTGHGSQTSWGSTGFSNTHVNALTNINMLPFISSVACNNGTFTGTCFAEAWLRASSGGEPTGAIAAYMSYISQSWNPPMCGQDEAVDLLVQDEMRTIGGLWFNGSCQMMDEYGAGGENEFLNWTIFGDPSVAVRTKAAQNITVNHSGALLIGMSEYEVSVPGVAGALCALYADGILYGSGTTNAAGTASISLSDPPGTPMTLTLTVTAYNKVTAVDQVEVLPPTGPYLVFEQVEVLDPTGDNDGILDAGEDVTLEVTLENVGVDGVSGITGTLICSDPFITIVTDTSGYPTIPAGGFGTCYDPFEILVAGNTPDGHLVQFTLHATSAAGDWDANFTLTVEAPLLTAGGIRVNDATGNASGTADAGETVQLQLSLGNSGHSDAVNLSGQLSSLDPNITILGAVANCASVPVGGTGTMGYFDVEILVTCPEPAMVDLHLHLTGADGFAADLDYQLAVGGWLDDFESNLDWTVGAPGDDASSGIWARLNPIGTEYNGSPCQTEDDHTADPGMYCFVTGNGSVGGSAGENDVDGGKTTLLSPVFHLEGAITAVFSYWRWYTNNLGNGPDEDYWDVDVTSNGTDWVSLEHTNVSANSWNHFSFDLTDYITLTNQVQVRFVAADEINGSLVEAAVDDVVLEATYQIITGIEGEASAPLRLTLGRNFPNPFNPKTTISFSLPTVGEVELTVFDVTGRRISTLVTGAMDAGTHDVVWHGRDDSGHPVASGLYFSRLVMGDHVLTGKMLMVK